MALPLTDRDKFLLLAALGLPESANRVIALLDLAGTGNMTGPGVATDNAVVRFDGTTGALVQNSVVTISDAGAVSGITSLSMTGQNLSGDGSAAAPAYSYTADPDTGMYRSGTNTLDFATGGSQRAEISAAGLEVTGAGQLFLPAGSVASPSLTFTVDQNTGIYRAGADDLRLSAGGVDKLSAQAAGILITGTNTLFIPDGLTATPSLAFTADQDTGLMRVGANHLALSAGGAARFHVNGSVIQIGESGDTSTIHQINSGLQAPAAGVLTLTNGPGASTGNPAVYLTLNINGTNYAIPAWAF